MEHWKEPESCAHAQRTGYNSPLVMGMGQTNAAPISERLVTAGKAAADVVRGRKPPEPPAHKKWVPLAVAGVLGFFAGMYYVKRKKR
jgi:hypothetical protein